MKNLTKEQQELVLDYYFRVADSDQVDLARDLIAANPEAAGMYDKLQMSMQYLDSLEVECCPDSLVDSTIDKLVMAAAAEEFHSMLDEEIEPATAATDITQLLAAEQQKQDEVVGNIKPHFSLIRIAQIASVAAVLLIMFNTLMPVFSNMRQNQYKTVCAANLGRISAGIESYRNSHDGRMPYVQMSDDAPWWKVGCQDQENQSNTRHYWLLVKGDYVEAENFVCPGREGSVPLKMDHDQIKDLYDFPSRANVSYSFRLTTEDTASRRAAQVMSVIMADRNPVFENISAKFDQDLFGKIALNETLLKKTSMNHNGNGQNVLLNGGSASFKERRVILNDDIYTLRGQRFYSGNERPTDSDDNFLVP